MPYSVEVKREIWEDKEGWRIEVGPDRDGLDWVEVRHVAEDGKVTERLSFPAELAEMVAAAMVRCAAELANATGA